MVILLFYFIIFAPLFSLISSLVFAHYLTKKQLIVLNLFSIFAVLIASSSLFLNSLYNLPIFFEDIWGIWISTSIIDIEFGFLCDSLTIYMLFVVSLISSLVHLYSIEYMRTDPNLIKFLQYLTLFTLTMFILITANNIVQMFIGWEGVGVCSFLLINFWDTRIQANTSAIKAILVNRIGDLGIILACILIFNLFGIFDYLSLFSLLEFFTVTDCNFHYSLITFFIFFGAMGKSSQLFLHVWLPDAMEGPTPVSALIHAATMVTAGVFLVIRCGSLFELVPGIKKFILIIGGLTALFAGSTGMVQNDLKKVIAYSTCSQLGFMFVACGLGLYDIALYHLSMHAFFKALLFLSAGSIIHAFKTDEQDIRRMGGLFNFLPITYSSLLIGSLALMGFPFTAGYYSKDLILEALLVTACPISKFALITCFLATICTIFYSTRLIILIFLNSSQITKHLYSTVHESSIFMLIPLIILSLFSLFGGYLFRDIFVHLSVETNTYLISYISLNSNFSSLWIYRAIEELSIFYRLLPFFLFIIVTSVTISYYLFPKKFEWFIHLELIRTLYQFFLKRWYFDICYAFISKYIVDISLKYLFIRGDRGFLEVFGPLGLSRPVNFMMSLIKGWEGGTPIFFLQQLVFGFGFILFLLILVTSWI